MKNIPFDPKKSVIPAFQTPIATFNVPGSEKLNKALEKEIHKRARMESGQVRSNVGGWHSEDDLFKWENPACQELREWLHSAVLQMVAVGAKSKKFTCNIGMAGWANINGPGQYNANHNHPGCHWSGVYYVDSGDYEGDPMPKAGHLQFYDPRGGINMIQHPGKSRFGGTMRIEPRDGLLVLFPAWLYHSVNPFLSDTQRLSIAFNAVIKKFKEAEPVAKGKKTSSSKAAGKKIAAKKSTRRKTASKKTANRKTASRKKT